MRHRAAHGRFGVVVAFPYSAAPHSRAHFRIWVALQSSAAGLPAVMQATSDACSIDHLYTVSVITQLN
jgi:hypothetical protein